MAKKKKSKGYGLNIDFNAYGLRPAGTYLDEISVLKEILERPEKSTAGDIDMSELQNTMDEAKQAADQLLKEMEDKETTLAKEAPKTHAEESADTPDLDELLAELDSLVGLDKIKQNVRSLISLAKVRKLREEMGLPIPAMSLHLVFMGNPGTGKNTVARLISQLYFAIGVLS